MTTAMIRAGRTPPHLAPSVHLLARIAPRTTVLRLSTRPIILGATVRRVSTLAGPTRQPLPSPGTYPPRRFGPNPEEAKPMLAALGYDSMEAFVKDTVPGSMRLDAAAVSERSIPVLDEHEMLPYAGKVGQGDKERRGFDSARDASRLNIVFDEFFRDLRTITGFAAASMPPNSEGKYPGLSVIRAYYASRGESHRDVCLVPVGARGINPVSLVKAGMRVMLVDRLPNGNLDLDDLRKKATEQRFSLAAFINTYTSTHSVLTPGVKEACQIIHDNGGQVYFEGVNMNAQIGLTNPAICGGDLCHLNLYKTFSIPQGSGGLSGPLCVAPHLAPFLPNYPIIPAGRLPIKPVASALLISWAYIKMLGGQGLSDTSRLALLKVGYIAHRLGGHYPLKYRNAKGRIAHGLLIDWEYLEKKTGLTLADIVVRLKDFGFHSLAITPTAALVKMSKSESSQEIDRFCDIMIRVRKEAEHAISNASDQRQVVVSSEAGWTWQYLRGVVTSRVKFPRFRFPRLKLRLRWATAGHANVHSDIDPMAKMPYTAVGLFVSIRTAAKTCIRSSNTSTMLTISGPLDVEKPLLAEGVGSDTDSEMDSEGSWCDVSVDVDVF